MTRDEAWFREVTGSVLKAVDWVARQRQLTRAPLPYSRGWEHGLLPAAALEDVQEYQYWMSNNLFTWRGLDRVAAALEAIAHPEASRVREEADGYHADLAAALTRAREQAPLVKLGDGRWVPHFPTRLYLRGRDGRWIADVLEGAIYLILTGFFEPTSREAGWILDDYLDNLYMTPPFGYHVRDMGVQWFDRGGFSIQPNLLAGLLPYLARDEVEVYIWMFFNALASCYREETGALVEHPSPELGFDNSVPIKTSDEANVTTWLRYMFVYDHGDTLYVGRAIPRYWMRDRQVVGARRVSTHYGEVSVQYRSRVEAGSIEVAVELDLRDRPRQTVVRIRHPEERLIREVTVNGVAHTAFDAARGDISELPAARSLDIRAFY